MSELIEMILPQYAAAGERFPVAKIVGGEYTVEVGGEDIIFAPKKCRGEYIAEARISPQAVCPKKAALYCRVTAGDRTETAWGEICLIPQNWWDGADISRLIALTSPYPDCDAVALEVRRHGGLHGYKEGRDAVRRTVAALFSVVRSLSVVREEGAPPCALDAAPFTKKTATPFALAAFFAGCVKAAGLNPVFLSGPMVGVGVWLFDACFLDDATPPRAFLAYHAAGDLCCICAEDLFAGAKAGFNASERKMLSHFGKPYRIFDLSRGRKKTAEPSAPAKALKDLPKGSLRAAWEAELFDLTSYAEARLTADMETLSRAAGTLLVRETEGEISEGILGVARGDAARIEALSHGAGSWFLALGASPEKLPVALIPVTLSPAFHTVAVTVAGEMFADPALLLLLKRRGIDLMGLMERKAGIGEIFATVRAAAALYGDFSEETRLIRCAFPRYPIWRDLHTNFTAFAQNGVVRSLLTGEKTAWERREETPVFPLCADSSQRAAIARAGSGESFVLYGPPGTGKSQTIANLIANAMYRGRKVLFVAAKRAARDVVRRRLATVGAENYCIALGERPTPLPAAAPVLLPDPPVPLPAREDLFSVGKFGFSPAEALDRAFDLADAPKWVRILPAFLRDGDKARADECRRLILAACEARVRGFETTELCETSPEIRDQVKTAAYLLRASIETLSSHLVLFGEMVAPVKLTAATLPSFRAVLKSLSRRRMPKERDLLCAFDGGMPEDVAHVKAAAMSAIKGTMGALRAYHVALKRYAAVTRTRGMSEGDIEIQAAHAAHFLENLDLLPAIARYQRYRAELKGKGVLLDAAADDGTRALESFEAALAVGSLSLPAMREQDMAIYEEAARKSQICDRAALRDALASRALSLTSRERAETARLSMRSAEEAAADPALLTRYLCVISDPVSVSRLSPETAFDLAVFDEASQMSTAEAIPALARAKAAVVVGDPNQLPPTGFFRSTGGGNSVLEDCLLAGMEATTLRWHYRSKHESLIAFSNAQFYGGALYTFPSPDRKSRVRLVPVGGTYERGGAKCNRAEIAALTAEVVRRLSDPATAEKSIGVVTFSVAASKAAERHILSVLKSRGLYDAAFRRAEPLFVRNLENVQGDERDVILLAVGYGPDAAGRVYHNFGPLSRADGWRRLNVAVSRAREEMLVFSSLKAEDLGSGTRGEAELKAFLHFAKRGQLQSEKTPVCGVAAHLAAALKGLGYRAVAGVGSSQFHVDVAVYDGDRAVLGILLDSPRPLEDELLAERMLKAGGWQIVRVSRAAYFCNPARELIRVRDALCCRPLPLGVYRHVKRTGQENVAFVTGGSHDGEIAARLKELVSVEQPIERGFLRRRLLATYGIEGGEARAAAKLDRLIDGCGFLTDNAGGMEYFYDRPKALGFDRFRVERGQKERRSEADYSVYETVALIRSKISAVGALTFEDLAALVAPHFESRSARFMSYLKDCVAYGTARGVLKEKNAVITIANTSEI